MKSLTLLSVLLVGLAPPQAPIKLEIGAKLNRKNIPKKITEVFRTGPSQVWPFIEPSLGGIKYIIAFDPKTREIKYIYTADPNFRTRNGLRVSTTIALTRAQLQIIPDWEIRAPVTPDGWYPIVGYLFDMFGFDLEGSFKGNETRMFSIVGFSKGRQLTRRAIEQIVEPERRERISHQNRCGGG